MYFLAPVTMSFLTFTTRVQYETDVWCWDSGIFSVQFSSLINSYPTENKL